jgi:hypothetical protein
MKNDKALFPAFAFSLFIFYAIPFAVRKFRDSLVRARWKKQGKRELAERRDADEYQHQTALRRERERLEMQAEIRIRELIATLQVQYMADAKKLERLSQIKAEFANRQEADMAGLLGRLEAMKAGK